MSILSADLHKAILTTWNDNGLNTLFSAYWSVANRSEFPVIHDEQAGPAQPWPYCIFVSKDSDLVTIMSGKTGVSNRLENREVPWEFRIHSRSMNGISAKVIGATLAAKIIEVFGGHPTVVPILPVLDTGSFIQANYVTDFPVRDGDNEYRWLVKYNFLIDLPVAA